MKDKWGQRDTFVATIRGLRDALEPFAMKLDGGELCFCPVHFDGTPHWDRCMAANAALAQGTSELVTNCNHFNSAQGTSPRSVQIVMGAPIEGIMTVAEPERTNEIKAREEPQKEDAVGEVSLASPILASYPSSYRGSALNRAALDAPKDGTQG